MINIDSIVNWIQSIHEPYTYLLVFAILLLCGFGLPIPEDITLIAAGLMAYYGKANVFVMIGGKFECPEPLQKVITQPAPTP